MRMLLTLGLVSLLILSSSFAVFANSYAGASQLSKTKKLHNGD